jgi:hypothetical protein
MKWTPIPISQVCSHCKIEKLLLEFPHDNNRILGRYDRCTDCLFEVRAEQQAKKTGKPKRQPSGDALMKSLDAKPRTDEYIENLNHKTYRKRTEKKKCAFPTCITGIRYRSPYAPYCERHGTPDKRQAAKAMLAGATLP